MYDRTSSSPGGPHLGEDAEQPQTDGWPAAPLRGGPRRVDLGWVGPGGVIGGFLGGAKAQVGVCARFRSCLHSYDPPDGDLKVYCPSHLLHCGARICHVPVPTWGTLPIFGASVCFRRQTPPGQWAAVAVSTSPSHLTGRAALGCTRQKSLWYTWCRPHPPAPPPPSNAAIAAFAMDR